MKEYGVDIVKGELGLDVKEAVPTIDYSPYNRNTFPSNGRWIDEKGGRMWVYIGPTSVFDVKIMHPAGLPPDLNETVELRKGVPGVGSWILRGRVITSFIQTPESRGNTTGGSRVVCRVTLKVKGYSFRADTTKDE